MPGIPAGFERQVAAAVICRISNLRNGVVVFRVCMPPLATETDEAFVTTFLARQIYGSPATRGRPVSLLAFWASRLLICSVGSSEPDRVMRAATQTMWIVLRRAGTSLRPDGLRFRVAPAFRVVAGEP